MTVATHPFAVGEPGNVPLPRAPLVRAIAQVRFPYLTGFAIDEDAVATRVAAALVHQYPVMEVGQEVSVTITAEGVSENRSATRLWRLMSGDRAWQISFSGTVLSIDTTNYVSRSDFAQRLADAWTALTQQVAVPYVERLGVRYINQLTDRDHLTQLPDLLRPEMLGISIKQEPGAAVLASALNEAQYQFPDDSTFRARWGLLPAGASIDSARPAHDYPTWFLDMDSFHAWAPSSHQDENLYEDVRALALRGYQFFRWAVTEKFLSIFGGEQ
ncbi:MAG TPA: TIGR04255 family protein [Pseudonocardiaceae bacterium]|nr:TIGR04255 family protein [Pseudonocardiaceae bacterium]